MRRKRENEPVAAFFDREKNRRSSTKDYGDRWTDGERKSTSNGMMKRGYRRGTWSSGKRFHRENN